MNDFFRTKGWELERPWLGGLLNGSIIVMVVLLSGAVTSEEPDSTVPIAIAAGLVVAVVRTAVLTREKKKRQL